MSHQNLLDVARSGVYRADSAAAAREAALAAGFETFEFDVGESRAEAFDQFARTLGFPEWFGHNLDALLDCLRDFKWGDEPGYLLLISGIDRLRDEDMSDFGEVLQTAAEELAEDGKAFFAIFLGVGPAPAIPDFSI